VFLVNLDSERLLDNNIISWQMSVKRGFKLRALVSSKFIIFEGLEKLVNTVEVTLE